MNLNTSPYYDDFDPSKNYLRILFRPGRSVQGRELTQLQTALQEQIRKLGDHILVDGTPVLNAKMKVDFNKNCIVLDTVDASGDPVVPADWEGRLFKGDTSGASAEVTNVDVSSRTIFFDYRGGKFQANEPITTFNLPGDSRATLTANTTALHVGVYAYQDEGIIYTNGMFVHVPKQSVMVDNLENNGNYKIGYEFKESVATSEMDSSLLDPANGSPNQNAPGADRLKGEIVPKAYKGNETPPDTFHAMIIAENGQIIKESQTTQYSAIMDTMASRTYDESGNYTVKDFPLVVEGTPDLTKVNLKLEPGKAYIQGYKNETIVTETIEGERARDTEMVNNEQVNVLYGPYVVAKKNAAGAHDITKMIRVHSKPVVNLYAGAKKVGEARVMSIDVDNTGSLRIYLADTAKAAALFTSIDRIAEKADTTRSINVNPGLNDVLAACPIYSLGESPVSAIEMNETNYDVVRSYHDVVKDGSGNFVIVADDNFTNFVQTSQNGVIAITTANGQPLLGSQFVATTTNINNGRSSISIQVTGGETSTTTIDVILRQHKTQGNPKTKTLTRHIDTFTLGGSDTTRTFPHYDVFRITQIRKAGVVEADISGYKFDNGQRDFYYGFGSLSNLETGVAYEVTYDYFRHEGAGDYFSVNSYDNVNNRTSEPEIYKLIPGYQSETGLTFDLRNSLDFRRTITDMDGGTDIIRPDSSLNVDYSFYLSRVDRIYIDKNGKFLNIKGISAKNPEPPEPMDGAMLLYELTYPAYTFDPQDVEVVHVDNRRYTMRDIGKLEKRLDIMEYYTSLSLLETKADAMTVLDANGFTKFKNGILVDSFVGHGVGMVEHPEYRCSMDSENGVLRTPFKIESFDLIKNTDGTNMMFHEHIATVGYTIEPWISQPLCSEISNVNPYNVFSWIGQMEMTPSTDNWVDTKRLPAVTTNFEGANDSMTKSVEALKDAGFLSTQWNSWQTAWTGSKRPTSRTTNVSKSAWSTSTSRRQVGSGRAGWSWFTRPYRDIQTTTTNRRTVTTTTKTNWIQDVGQRRSGTTMQVVPGTITKSIGDKVIDTSFIPWMREKEVKFKADGLKPSIQLRATFDTVEVTEHCKPEGGAYGDNLMTDEAGSIVGTFKIPEGTFRTGARIFRLEDDENQPTTAAEFTFQATGLLETKQENIISVDNPQIVPKTVEQTRTIQNSGVWTSSSRRTETTQSSNTTREWYDPLAQSFLVAEDSGVFVESIDLFFKTKDSGLPVTVFIVENENGYPSQRRVPFSEVTLKPADVQVDPAGRLATKFKFSDPVYLQGSTEYSFVVMSNSNKYECFIGKIGGKQYRLDSVSGTWKNDGAVITKQPYTGVMFKSQNSSTWSADQERDIKFAMHRCVFSTTEATAKFMCKDLSATYGAGYQFDLTTMMLNMDTLKLPGTIINHSVKLRGGDQFTVENKSNYSVATMRELKTVVGEDAPIQVESKLTAPTSYISPVINLQRNSFLGISNILEDIPGAGSGDYKNAGTYVTRPVNLVNESDDLRVYLDTMEVPNSLIKVWFKTTEYIPRHFIAGSAIGDQYTDSNMQVYWKEKGQDNWTYKATFKATNVDGTRIDVSQLTDVNAFIDAGDFDANDIDAILIMRTENKLITEVKDWKSDNWPIGTVVKHNGEYWQAQREVTNDDAEPTLDSVVWFMTPHTTANTLIQESTAEEWREMKAIDSNNNPGQFTEKTFVPTNVVDSEFSSFQIKIELLSRDPVNVPTARALRAMALY